MSPIAIMYFFAVINVPALGAFATATSVRYDARYDNPMRRLDAASWA